MPGLVSGYDRQPGEIVITNKERIVVEHLSAGWLVVGVIQAHQSVSQEGSKLSASFSRLLRCARGLNDLNEGSAGLQLGIAIVVETARPGCPLAIGKHRPRHFEFPKFIGKRDQGLRGRLSL